MIRAIVAAKSSIVCEGLRGVLAGTAVQVLGATTSPPEAAELARTLSPDVAFLGLHMAELQRFATVQAIRRASPATAVIVVSLEGDAESLLEALGQGASCYLCCDISAQSLVLAAEAAVQGFVLANRTALRGSLAGRTPSA